MKARTQTLNKTDTNTKNIKIKNKQIKSKQMKIIKTKWNQKLSTKKNDNERKHVCLRWKEFRKYKHDIIKNQ